MRRVSALLLSALLLTSCTPPPAVEAPAVEVPTVRAWTLEQALEGCETLPFTFQWECRAAALNTDWNN